MGKPNLGEAAAEPHSVLLDEVHLPRYWRRNPIWGRIDTFGEGQSGLGVNAPSQNT